MLPYDPTSPRKQYYKFCSTVGTAIQSYIIIASGEVEKIQLLMLPITIAIRMVADVPDYRTSTSRVLIFFAMMWAFEIRNPK